MRPDYDSKAAREIRNSLIWIGTYLLTQILMQMAFFWLAGAPNAVFASLMGLLHIAAHVAGVYKWIGISLQKPGTSVNMVATWWLPMAAVEAVGAIIFIVTFGAAHANAAPIAIVSFLIGLLINLLSVLLWARRDMNS